MAVVISPLVIFVLSGSTPGNRQPERIVIRCPNCRNHVTLDHFGPHDIETSTVQAVQVTFGQRTCPNCQAHLFVVYDRPKNLLVSYPPETIEFDASDVPKPVREALEEAITCHAHQCCTAGAIMVRKTLEELCYDRGSTNGNLKEKIASLRDKVTLPEAMFNALDNLRLLGNDATHVESRVFNQVGQQELSVAIEVTKEILKATYQYKSLMGQLEALKRGTLETPSAQPEEQGPGAPPPVLGAP